MTSQTEQQIAALLWELRQKIEGLESKVRHLESMLHHIDQVTVKTANMVQTGRK
jgi:hypothetical protein